jgi:hypothetical protein
VWRAQEFPNFSAAVDRKKVGAQVIREKMNKHCGFGRMVNIDASRSLWPVCSLNFVHLPRDAGGGTHGHYMT